ncbi:hypothetical protein KF840_25795 [bacterium]|nr:hypothetical protein [bacterium]
MRPYHMLIALTALALGCAAKQPATSAAPRFTLDPKKTTCAEFLALGRDVQPRLIAWADGYSRAGTLRQQDIGVVDVDRQTQALVVACEQAPTESFWDKVRAHMPGGSKHVQPTRMTCEEFADLSESERPEVAYWIDGYNHGVKQDDVGAIDLRRDTATILVACKPTPQESVWKKIAQAF